jgi:transcription termination factor NusB
MDILHRIHARKVVLGAIYQYYFFLRLAAQHGVVQDSLALAHTFTESEDFGVEKEQLVASFASMQAESMDDDYIAYVLQYVYESWWDSVDYPYMERMLQKISSYTPTIEKLVNTYVTSFSFDDMDPMDKALFTLGCVEYKEFETPKEVLLNELVELAKRYADPGSSKLINGIMHKILTAIV